MTQPVDPSDSSDDIPVAVDATFTITPTWVTEADISDRAHRLYCVLRHIADYGTGYGWAKRSTLAAKLRVKSLDSVDRAMAELVEIGAVKVIPRWSAPEDDKAPHRLANGYMVRSVQPAGGSRTPAATPPDTPGWPQDSGQGGRTPAARVAAENLEQNVEPLTNNPLSIKNNARTARETASAFDAFWAAYPKKTGKDAARRKWVLAVKRAGGPEPIMEGLGRYRWPADPQFTKDPATWLHQGCWQDEPSTAPVTAARPAPRAMTSAEIIAKRQQGIEETYRRLAELEERQAVVRK